MREQNEPNDTLSVFNVLQDIIGHDVGNRGMKALIVPGDLYKACRVLALELPKDGANVVVLSGFPCCTTQVPPTETDGPPGSIAICRALIACGYAVTLVTDECNRAVFEAAMNQDLSGLTLKYFPSKQDWTLQHEDDLQLLCRNCNAIVACERAGPAADGHCYTMRGIDMTAENLVAPLERIVQEARNVPFIAIGDGGNELGMGKVLDKILDNPKINKASQVACVVPADYLIAASVSNWGGYALAAGIAYLKANEAYQRDNKLALAQCIDAWVTKCVPTRQEEIDLLNRCVSVGCRDGVSGKQEATVDGMPLETSLECLDKIRLAVLSPSNN